MTTYYQLHCATCDELFKPLVATSPEELLHPDYDNPDSGGYNLELLMESLQTFHEAHGGHALEAIDAEWIRIENSRLVPLRLP